MVGGTFTLPGVVQLSRKMSFPFSRRNIHGVCRESPGGDQKILVIVIDRSSSVFQYIIAKSAGRPVMMIMMIDSSLFLYRVSVACWGRPARIRFGHDDGRRHHHGIQSRTAPQWHPERHTRRPILVRSTTHGQAAPIVPICRKNDFILPSVLILSVLK
jgi:hypothetical protein